ncbi:hypothetical protein GQ457_15G022590 [Hibiscus cannabinus]
MFASLISSTAFVLPIKWLLNHPQPFKLTKTSVSGSSALTNSVFGFMAKVLMGETSFSMRNTKGRSWQRCSKHIREQRGRLYIIWRCTVLLLCWND